jgi:hypothetical protein
MAPNVRKYRPQNDHVERSDLAKRFFIAGWERERAERAKSENSRSLMYSSLYPALLFHPPVLWSRPTGILKCT